MFRFCCWIRKLLVLHKGRDREHSGNHELEGTSKDHPSPTHRI